MVSAHGCTVNRIGMFRGARSTRKRSIQLSYAGMARRKGLEPLTREVESRCFYPTELPAHERVTLHLLRRWRERQKLWDGESVVAEVGFAPTKVGDLWVMSPVPLASWIPRVNLVREEGIEPPKPPVSHTGALPLSYSRSGVEDGA